MSAVLPAATYAYKRGITREVQLDSYGWPYRYTLPVIVLSQL